MSGMRHTVFHYRGPSMWPCFQDGDLLEIEAVPRGKIRVGDCVVLQRDGSDGIRIVHRVVGLRGGLRTRGDAVASADSADPASLQLIGRVAFRHRLGRRSAVAGGWQGLLTGKFYYYAGRIDPERPGRGGRVGRLVRSVCAPLASPFMHHPRGAQGPGLAVVWKVGDFVVAHRERPEEGWRVFWPWRLVVPAPQVTRQG